MLRVDLVRLERRRRLRIDETVATGDERWAGTGIRPAGPFEVGLDVTEAGPDVLVRGRIAGTAEAECRRCLNPTVTPMDVVVTLLYRKGADPAEAEAEEAYPLPEREQELDLWPALREHLILAAPAFVECRPDCRGLCPRCGAELNDGPCDCGGAEPDARWAVLRGLKR